MFAFAKFLGVPRRDDIDGAEIDQSAAAHDESDSLRRPVFDAAGQRFTDAARQLIELIPAENYYEVLAACRRSHFPPTIFWIRFTGTERRHDVFLILLHLVQATVNAGVGEYEVPVAVVHALDYVQVAVLVGSDGEFHLVAGVKDLIRVGFLLNVVIPALQQSPLKRKKRPRLFGRERMAWPPIWLLDAVDRRRLVAPPGGRRARP